MDHEWRKDPKKRDAASKHLRVVSDRALEEDKPIEVLEQENAGAHVTEGGIPVMWGNSAGQRLRGREATIKTPSQEEKEMAVHTRVTCSSCVHFDIKEGRKEIVKQQFAEKLVLEYEWALRHLGGSVDHLGLCGRSDGELCVTTVSPACDGFRERKGRI
jgi:hypothetical protein